MSTTANDILALVRSQIGVKEVPAGRAEIPAPAPSASEKLRADVDFLSAMTGVQL